MYGVRQDKTGKPESDTGPPKPVQAFDYETKSKGRSGSEHFPYEDPVS